MRNIFLIGISGSGKSTVGRILAERLGKPFIDTDTLVAENCGDSISAIFAQYGEDYFRACESRALAQAAQIEGGTIIATGGGLVMRQENRDYMAQRGLRIYLSVDLNTALLRLNQQQATSQSGGFLPEIRPLLAGSDSFAALHSLFSARSAWYEEADFTCNTLDKSPERVVQDILAILISTCELDTLPAIVRHVQVGSGYDAIVHWGGLGSLPHYLTQLKLASRIFLITDSNIIQLYIHMLIAKLADAGFETQPFIVPAGEASKSQHQLNAIYDWLIEQRAERSEAIIAVGGGMVGDLAGYAAATYLRGVPLVQVPTSLLAQVDAAIGGKTGINHARGKNLIGAFYHPRLVLVDPSTLLTLPLRVRTEGWAEVVKYGIILDTELFAQLEAYADILRDFSHPPATLLCQIIARCITLKASVIEMDEREQGRRAILNYGHTVAHALENVTGYGELLHGEAVSLGMVAAAAIAKKAGMFPHEEETRQNQLLMALGLPIVYTGQVQAHDILASIQLDKKVTAKRVRWIMPRTIGQMTITHMPDDVVQGVISEQFAEKRS